MKLNPKISLCVAGSLLLTSVATGVLVLRNKESILTENLRYLSDRFAANLSTFCAEALHKGDNEYLEEHLKRAAQENPQIAYVRVWKQDDLGGFDLAARYAPPNPRPEPENGYLVFRKSIRTTGAEPGLPLGKLEIGISTAEITRFVHLATWQLMPGFIIAFAILTLILNFALKRTVLDRIRKLDRHTELMSRGQFDTPVESLGSDELGRLAGALESMRVSLKQQHLHIKQKLVELEESKEKFEALLEAAPDAMIIAEPGGRVMFANTEAEKLFSYTPEKLLEKRLEDLLPEGPFRRVDKAQEYGALTGGGETLRVAVTTRPLKMKEEVYRTLSIRDIVERSQLEAELLRAKKVAESANMAKSDFLANMSHELRTPLHGILAFAGFGFRRHATAKPEKLRDYFSQIKESGETLLTLLNDLLDLSKLEAGRSQLKLGQIDLAKLLTNIVNEFKPLASDRRITMEWAKPEDKPEVIGDKDKIRQVIRNLFSNAVKFSPEDKPVHVQLEQRCGSVVISVRDHGPGIPEGEFELVFDKFVQSSKTRSGSGGTGLGLAICREITVLHQGRIWVENHPEGGAHFFLEIPKARESSTARSQEVAEVSAPVQ